jgi:hypothetical protein
VSCGVSVLAKPFVEVFQGIFSPAKIMFSCLCPLSPSCRELLLTLSLAVEKRIAVFIVTSYSTSIYPSILSIPFHLIHRHRRLRLTTYTLLYFILLYFKTKSLTSQPCSSYLFLHLPHRQRPRSLLPVSLPFTFHHVRTLICSP